MGLGNLCSSKMQDWVPASRAAASFSVEVRRQDRSRMLAARRACSSATHRGPDGRGNRPLRPPSGRRRRSPRGAPVAASRRRSDLPSRPSGHHLLLARIQDVPNGEGGSHVPLLAVNVSAAPPALGSGRFWISIEGYRDRALREAPGLRLSASARFTCPIREVSSLWRAASRRWALASDTCDTRVRRRFESLGSPGTGQRCRGLPSYSG